MIKEGMFVKKLRIVFSEEKYILIAAFSTATILFLFAFSMGLIAIPNVPIIRMIPITPLDIVFMLVFSSIAGIAIAFYWYSKSGGKEICTLSSGLFAGFLTSVCPFCPILILSLLGVSLTLEFLAPFFPFLRILSLSLLLLSLYWLSKTVKIK